MAVRPVLRKKPAPSTAWRKGANPTRQRTKLIPVPTDAATLAAAAKSFSPHALNTLVAAMRSKRAPWPARIQAAVYILERGYGKIPQPVEGSLEVRRTLDVTQLTAVQRTMLASMLSQARFAGEAKVIEAAPVESDPGEEIEQAESEDDEPPE